MSRPNDPEIGEMERAVMKRIVFPKSERESEWEKKELQDVLIALSSVATVNTYPFLDRLLSVNFCI